MRSGGGVTAGAARSRRGDAVRVKQLATVDGDGAAYARGAAPGGWRRRRRGLRERSSLRRMAQTARDPHGERPVVDGIGGKGSARGTDSGGRRRRRSEPVKSPAEAALRGTNRLRERGSPSRACVPIQYERRKGQIGHLPFGV